MRVIGIILWLAITIGFSILFVNGCRERYVRDFCSTPIGPYAFNENLYCKETHTFMPPIDWWDDWKLREHISAEFYFQFVMDVILLLLLCCIPPFGILYLWRTYK